MNMQKQQQLSCSYLEKLDFYRINVESDMVRDLSSRNVGCFSCLSWKVKRKGRTNSRAKLIKIVSNINLSTEFRLAYYGRLCTILEIEASRDDMFSSVHVSKL